METTSGYPIPVLSAERQTTLSVSFITMAAIHY